MLVVDRRLETENELLQAKVNSARSASPQADVSDGNETNRNRYSNLASL